MFSRNIKAICLIRPCSQSQKHCPNLKAMRLVKVCVILLLTRFLYSGYGISTRKRHCSQGSEDKEHLPRKRKSRHHGFWAIQRHEAVLWE